MKKTKMF